MSDLRAQVVEAMELAIYNVEDGVLAQAEAALDAALTRLKAENLWLRGVSLGRFLDEVLGDSGKGDS